MRTKLILTGILAIAVAGICGTVVKAHPISFAAQPALTLGSESPFLVLVKSGKHGKHHKWRGKWARDRGGWYYYYPALAYPYGLPPGFVIPDAPAPQVDAPPAAVLSPPPAVEPAPPASQPPSQAAVRPISPQVTPAPSPSTPSPTPQAAVPPTTEADASAASHWGSRNSGPLTPLAPLSQPRPKRTPQNEIASPAKPATQWQNPEKLSQ